MKKLIGILFVAAGLVSGVGATAAQNRDMRVLSQPSTAVVSEPDDFSRFDIGDVVIGRYQTYHYAGFELGLKAIVPKDGGAPTYTAYAVAPRLRAPGVIRSMAARGLGPLEEFSRSSGDVSCGGPTCRNTAMAAYVLNDQVTQQLRAGVPVDVRVTTSCGADCDMVLPIEPRLFAMLEQWVRSLPSQQTGRTPPTAESPPT